MFIVEGQQGERALYHLLHVSEAAYKEKKHVLNLNHHSRHKKSKEHSTKRGHFSFMSTFIERLGWLVKREAKLKNSLFRVADPKVCHFLLKIVHQSNLREGRTDRQTDRENSIIHLCANRL